MKDFSRGVSYFTHGKVDISFPEDDICCHWCPMLGVEIKSDREYCRKTGEYLSATKHVVGFNCPINFENTEKEN